MDMLNQDKSALFKGWINIVPPGHFFVCPI